MSELALTALEIYAAPRNYVFDFEAFMARMARNICTLILLRKNRSDSLEAERRSLKLITARGQRGPTDECSVLKSLAFNVYAIPCYIPQPYYSNSGCKGKSFLQWQLLSIKSKSYSFVLLQ